MAGHIGKIGDRIEAVATLVSEYSYTTQFGYRYVDHYIYTLKDEDSNELVWKTTALLGIEAEDERGNCFTQTITKGSTIKIKATIKAHSEYKGREQTEIQRVKVSEIIEQAPTKEEREAERAAEQLAALEGDDITWRMPYKQYREHYADCETLAGSYTPGNQYRTAEITVIIRAGRLKASGVRGKHYRGYSLQNEKGERATYRAVSEENAIKRANKEFPGENWECVKVYQY